MAAEESADRASTLDPTHYHAYWIKGDIYHAQEDFFHAEAEYQKLPRLDEEVAHLYGWDALEEYGKIHTLTLARLDYGDIYANSWPPSNYSKHTPNLRAAFFN